MPQSAHPSSVSDWNVGCAILTLGAVAAVAAEAAGAATIPAAANATATTQAFSLFRTSSPDARALSGLGLVAHDVEHQRADLREGPGTLAVDLDRDTVDGCIDEVRLGHDLALIVELAEH